MVDVKSELNHWINVALQNENVTNIEIKDILTPNKGEGFVGGIYFVDVTAIKNNTLIDYPLVIKYGKKGDPKREKGLVTKVFERELFVYEKVFKGYKDFENSCKVKDHFDAYPKFYGGLILADTEVIVLENLKPAGFEMHAIQPMNLEHRNAVCQQFAKMHAVSFAMRDKWPDQFQELASNLDNELLVQFFEEEGITDLLLRGYEDNLKILEKHKATDLIKYLEKFTTDDLRKMFDPIDCEPYTAFLHGDDWNNNFLFKYNNSKSSPDKVIMIDFQIVRVSSPMEELVYFFYFNTDPARYDDEFMPFMELYYDYLSGYLNGFGCDANKLYPKSLLKEHWRKYAGAGFLCAPLMFKMRCTNMEDIEDKGNFSEILDFKMSNTKEQNESFEKTVLNHFKHFINNRLI